MSKTNAEEQPKQNQQEPPKEVLEDDDFEEFPAEDWQTQEENFPVWEDNWDDDDVEEDFAQQLMQQKR
jgi:26 proteasome complex subunit DSS1